jgi:hypothetical protein|tara:strand:+ start:20 stop:451 length:432 start_codon:yes stop_codon:yes gene_type:complete
MADNISVSDTSAVTLPIRNLLSIITAIALGVWGWFGVVERLNRLETNEQLVRKDLKNGLSSLRIDIEKNNEFRVLHPRGQLGTSASDQEQFLLIEALAKAQEKIQERIEAGLSNGVNIKRLREDVKILRGDVEKLKDKARGIN